MRTENCFFMSNQIKEEYDGSPGALWMRCHLQFCEGDSPTLDGQRIAPAKAVLSNLPSPYDIPGMKSKRQAEQFDNPVCVINKLAHPQ